MSDFVKYHGLGNDFVVVEGPDRRPEEGWVERVCDRRRGVGGDGVLVVAPPGTPEADGAMILYNRDGTRPEMCGNGLRCVARYMVERGESEATSFVRVETDAGLRRCRVTERGPEAWQIAVEMGRPIVDEAPIERNAAGERRRFWPVDMGNPHAVSFGGATERAVDRFGEAMNDLDEQRFVDGVNVECTEVVDDRTLEVVVYERGVGRTQACGTGACAAAVAGWRTGRLASDGPATVRLPGGTLEIEEDEDNHLWMTGPVVAVFRGRFTASTLGPLAREHGSEQ